MNKDKRTTLLTYFVLICLDKIPQRTKRVG